MLRPSKEGSMRAPKPVRRTQQPGTPEPPGTPPQPPPDPTAPPPYEDPPPPIPIPRPDPPPDVIDDPPSRRNAAQFISPRDFSPRRGCIWAPALVLVLAIL